MPSLILGPIKITEAGGTVNFGDLLNNTSTSTSKSYTGSGSGNTGDFIQVNNVWSLTKSVDPDISDASNTTIEKNQGL